MLSDYPELYIQDKFDVWMFHDIGIALLFPLYDLCAFGICCFGSIKHASFFAINFDYIFPLLLSHT